MKVISGILKGRKIDGYDIKGTRPTMDRVKESLFAIIQDYIDDSVVLDLFSGSGNLGIEAISNGSKLVYFNDINKIATDVIKSNLASFHVAAKAKVLNLDYKKCLSKLCEDKIKFDIIFLDPPYKEHDINEIITYLVQNDMITSNGIIVCETDDNYLREFDSLTKIKEKRYGDKFIIIYKKDCF